MEKEQHFTSGTWKVKAGKEAEFIRLWEDFANWTKRKQTGVGMGRLLQDTSHPNHFLSFGDWDSLESIQTWRATAEFAAFFSKAQQLCDEVLPATLKLVAQTSG